MFQVQFHTIKFSSFARRWNNDGRRLEREKRDRKQLCAFSSIISDLLVEFSSNKHHDKYNNMKYSTILHHSFIFTFLWFLWCVDISIGIFYLRLPGREFHAFRYHLFWKGTKYRNVGANFHLRPMFNNTRNGG